MKIAKILVRKTYRRMFNVLVDDSADIIGAESALRHIIEEDDSKFFFEEDHKSVMFAGMDLLVNFPYANDVEFGVHKIVPDDISGDKLTLREVTVSELVELHLAENK